MYYFDNAATTMHKPPQVVDAVSQALCSFGNPGRGAHDGSLDAGRVVYDTRVRLAKLFDFPHPERIAFTANATEALNMAISGLFRQGDHVITTALEHNSVLRPLYRLEDAGMVGLSILPADNLGCIDYASMEGLIRPNTRAIVCTHASNLTGNVVDIARVGEICRKHGLVFLADVSQTAGVLPISMEQMHIDILCFTGHKGLMGPQGTGGICVGEGITLTQWKVGGSGFHSYDRCHPQEYPTFLEAGTLNAHGIAGLNAALQFIESTGIDQIQAHENALMELFYREVCKIPGVRILGDYRRSPRAAIVSLNIRDYDSSAVADALYQDYNIAVRPGAHCAPLMHHALGTVSQGAVRFSFGWYNTRDEVLYAADAVRALANDTE